MLFTVPPHLSCTLEHSSSLSFPPNTLGSSQHLVIRPLCKPLPPFPPLRSFSHPPHSGLWPWAGSSESQSRILLLLPRCLQESGVNVVGNFTKMLLNCEKDYCGDRGSLYSNFNTPHIVVICPNKLPVPCKLYSLGQSCCLDGQVKVDHELASWLAAFPQGWRCMR